MRHCLGGLAQAHRRQLPNLGAGSLAVGSRAPAALPQPVHAASSPCPWTLPPGPALLGLVLWRPNPCQLGPVLPPSPCSRGACVQGWASALALLPRPRLLWTWTRPPHGACSPSAGGDFGWVVLAAPRVLRVIARPCPGPLQGQDGCWDQEGPSSAPKQVAGAGWARGLPGSSFHFPWAPEEGQGSWGQWPQTRQSRLSSDWRVLIQHWGLGWEHGEGKGPARGHTADLEAQTAQVPAPATGPPSEHADLDPEGRGHSLLPGAGCG